MRATFRGYLGEAIVYQWLKSKWPVEEYNIVKQIYPVGVKTKGGPYLDFGVIKKNDNSVRAIYEVKTQDYSINKFNASLCHCWTKKIDDCIIQNNDNKPKASLDIEIFCVVLKKPSEKAWENLRIEFKSDLTTETEIKRENRLKINNIIYFNEIISKIDNKYYLCEPRKELDEKEIFEEMEKEAKIDIENIIELARLNI